MKPIILFFSVFFLALLIVNFGAIYSYNALENDILEERVLWHLETTAQSRANYIENFIDEQKDKFLIAATHQELSNEELKKIVENNRGYTEMFVLDSNGIIVTSSEESIIGINKSDDFYFLEGKKRIIFKDVYFSDSLNDIAFAIFAPQGEGNVLVVRIDMGSLNEITSNRVGLGETGESYLINKEGYMVSSSRFKEGVILKEKADTINAENCLNVLKNKLTFTIDVTFPLHDNEANPIAVAGITFFYDVKPGESKRTKFTETKENAIKIGEDLDSKINGENQIENYDYVNSLIDDIVETNPNLKRISIHAKAPEGKSPSGYWILASSVPEKIGRESDPEDIAVIKNNKVVVLEEASHIPESEINAHVGHQAVTKFLDYREEYVFGTHAHIPEMHWCVLVEIDKSEIFNKTRRDGHTELLITSLILSLGVVTGTLFWIFILRNKRKRGKK